MLRVVADPDQSRAVGMQRLHTVVREAGHHCRIVKNPARLECLRVDGDDAVTVGAEPDFAGAHLGDGMNAFRRQQRLRTPLAKGAGRAVLLRIDHIGALPNSTDPDSSRRCPGRTSTRLPLSRRPARAARGQSASSPTRAARAPPASRPTAHHRDHETRRERDCRAECQDHCCHDGSARLRPCPRADDRVRCQSPPRLRRHRRRRCRASWRC